MWIVLNPKKAHRFTTKGINLHKGAPTAFVDPGLDQEFVHAIERAIADGRVIRISGDQIDGFTINNQAKIQTINEEDTDLKGSVKSGLDEDGIRINTITMPDCDGSVSEKPVKRGVIITGIYDEPLEDEEED